MSEQANGPSSSRHSSPMRRLVGVVTVVFWGSAAIMTALVGLSWAPPGCATNRPF
jgi:hypothetical protein